MSWSVLNVQMALLLLLIGVPGSNYGLLNVFLHFAEKSIPDLTATLVMRTVLVVLFLALCVPVVVACYKLWIKYSRYPVLVWGISIVCVISAFRLTPHLNSRLDEPLQDLDHWHKELKACPCTLDSSEIEGPGRSLKGVWMISLFHPGVTKRWAEDGKLAGQQCNYDENGKLITAGIAAGTPDSVGFGNNPLRLAGHILFDVLPYLPGFQGYMLGYKNNFMLEWYYENYPPNQGRNNNGDPCPPNEVNIFEQPPLYVRLLIYIATSCILGIALTMALHLVFMGCLLSFFAISLI